jgi:hypothetical protein
MLLFTLFVVAGTEVVCCGLWSVDDNERGKREPIFGLVAAENDK